MGVEQKPEPLAPEFAAKFREIRLNFIAGLPRRLEEIRHETDAAQCYTALHRLAGAAGGYGFAHLSDLARDAMHAIEASSKPTVKEAIAKLELAMDAVVRLEKTKRHQL